MRPVCWYRDPLLAIANSRRAVVATLVLSVLVFAAAFTVLEQDNPHLAGHPKAGFWVACYWTITTMTTTGYGDVSPATLPGEFLACCLMLWAAFFLLPVVVAHVITSMLHDPDAWTDAEQEQLLADVAALKANVEGLAEDLRRAGRIPVLSAPSSRGGSE